MDTIDRHSVRPRHYSSHQTTKQQELQPFEYLAPREYDAACLVWAQEAVEEGYEWLKTSLSEALADYRWLAGSIEADTTGRLYLRADTSDAVSLYSRKIDDMPTFSELQDAGFPQDNFDTGVLLPPGDWSPTGAQPQTERQGAVRTAAFQITIIRGGMIIGLVWHQSCCDTPAMFTFVRRWAELSRLRDTRSRISTSKLSESRRLPARLNGFTRDEARMAELNKKMRMRKYSTTDVPTHNLWNPGVYSSILHFRQESFRELLEKSLPLTAQLTSKPSRRILLHHAVVSMVYKRAMEARWRSFHARPTATTDLSMRVDLRSSPPFINTGFGNTTVNAVMDSMELREILSGTSLPVLVDKIRDATMSTTFGQINEMCEWVERMDAPRRATLKIDTALCLNFAALDYRPWRLSELDFGFGSPKAFRHGRPPRNGLVLLLPLREGHSGLEVLVSLEQSSLRRLLDDWELKMFATPVIAADSRNHLARSHVGNDRGEGR